MTIRPATLPPYLNNFVHPGIYSSETPTIGMRALNPRYTVMYATILTQQGYNMATMGLVPPDSIRRAVTIEMQKRLMTSIDRTAEGTCELHDREYHEKMLEAAKPYLSQDLTTFTPERLLQMIQKIHEAGETDPSTFGYRTDERIVCQRGVTTQVGNSRAMIEFLEQHAPGEIPLFNVIQNKMRSYQQSLPTSAEFNYGNVYKNAGLSPEEKAFLDKYYHICLAFSAIPVVMKDFAAKLLARLKSGEDPIITAAFAHMQIVKIHPFGDSNGRLARAIMNLILAKAKLPPIAFAFDREYCRAIEDTTPTNPAFERLIRAKVEVNKGKTPAIIEAELTAIAEASKNIRAIQALWAKVPRATRRAVVDTAIQQMRDDIPASIRTPAESEALFTSSLYSLN